MVSPNPPQTIPQVATESCNRRASSRGRESAQRGDGWGAGWGLAGGACSGRGGLAEASPRPDSSALEAGGFGCCSLKYRAQTVIGRQQGWGAGVLRWVLAPPWGPVGLVLGLLSREGPRRLQRVCTAPSRVRDRLRDGPSGRLPVTLL